MSGDWTPPPPPVADPISPVGWALIALRAPVIALIVFGGLALMILLRQIERPVFGMRRPVTPWITLAVCRLTLWAMGLRVLVTGKPLQQPGAMVANHASWLDIFVLNSRKTLYFVSKAEVAAWPGIGWLARATGTVFIRRDRREAQKQKHIFEERLIHNHRLLFFPEGTSTDGRRVLPFKSTLFAAFFDDRLRHKMRLQAVTLAYVAPADKRADFYGWWGDMEFVPSLVQVLAQARQGQVHLIYHPSVRVDDFPNRKTLASSLETQMRAAHDAALQTSGHGGH